MAAFCASGAHVPESTLRSVLEIHHCQARPDLNLNTPYAGQVRRCKAHEAGRLGDSAGLLALGSEPQPLMRAFSSASKASTLDLSIILVGTMISLFSGTTDLSPSRYFAINFMPW